MNEILFENKFRRDKASFKEIFFSYFFNSPIVIACNVVSALYTNDFIDFLREKGIEVKGKKELILRGYYVI